MKAVVIKDIDVICAGGNDLEESWQALIDGRDVIRTSFGQAFAKLQDDMSEELKILQEQKGSLRGQDLTCLLAAKIAKRLVARNEIDPSCGVIISSSRGQSHALENAYGQYFGSQKISPKTSPQTTLGTLSSLTARSCNLQGLHFSVSAACASSLHAIGVAYSLIKSGVLTEALAGGSEHAENQFTVDMLRAARVYCSEPQNSFPHRPMASDRSGMVLGNGAGLVALRAKSVDALVDGDIEVLAYTGATEDSGMTSVDIQAKGLQLAIRQCLKQASLDADQIDFVVGHGASTIKGDQAESNAYQAIFDDEKPIFYHKWLTGHTLGAAGILSLAFAVKHFESGMATSHPYPNAINESAKIGTGQNWKYALVCCLGFGGNMACLILKKHGPTSDS